jgi:hypothetical protein
LLPILEQAGLASRAEKGEVRMARQVTLTLTLTRADGEGEILAIGGYFERGIDGTYSIDPLCLVGPVEAAMTEVELALWGRLAAANRRSAFPCIVRRAPGP